MNLQPRQVKRGAWSLELPNYPTDWGGEGTIAKPRPSIWRMELPNTSYMAPQAAFWWVSNEKR